MTTQPLPPQAHRAEIPEGLARVILRCLEKDRERRYRDVGALALALKEFGAADAALAAARVERILGRSAAPEAAVIGGERADEAAESAGVTRSIPGVPPR